jgi:CCR4-NOT transcription complex subunit 1
VQYITLLHQQNVLKSEELTEVFLRLATELCVDACAKTAPSEGASEGVFAYTVIDALSNLLVILVKYGSVDPQSVTSRVHLLSRILGTVGRCLVADAEATAPGRRPFDQRPYFRILVNLLRDLNTTDPVVEVNNLQVLGAFASCFHALQPQAVPTFAFAWLELVSHRSFMPALLLAKVDADPPSVHARPNRWR